MAGNELTIAYIQLAGIIIIALAEIVKIIRSFIKDFRGSLHSDCCMRVTPDGAHTSGLHFSANNPNHPNV